MIVQSLKDKGGWEMSEAEASPAAEQRVLLEGEMMQYILLGQDRGWISSGQAPASSVLMECVPGLCCWLLGRLKAP